MLGASRERHSRRWSRGRTWALRIFLVALAMPLVGTSAWVYARMVLQMRTPPVREAARVAAPPPAPAASRPTAVAPERAPMTEAPAAAGARTAARAEGRLSTAPHAAAPPAAPAETAPVPPPPRPEASRMLDAQAVPPAPLGAIVRYPAGSAAAFAAATRVAAQLEPAFGRVELVAGAGAPGRTEIRFRSDADHQAARVAGAMLGALGYSWRIAGLAHGGHGPGAEAAPMLEVWLPAR